MQLVVGLSVRRTRMHFFQAILIVRTPGVDTLPDDEELPVLYRNQGTAAEGTSDLVFLTNLVSPGENSSPQTLHWYWPLEPLFR